MKKHLPLLLLSLLVLALVACGGDETAVPAPPETAPDSSPATAAAPTEPAAQPTLEAQPVAEPTAEPTAEPAPTAAPADAPAAEASGAGWGASGSTAQSACDHPYFPLRAGATWTLAGADGAEVTWEVLSVAGDLQEATADLQMTTDEVVFVYTWDCSEDGGLNSAAFANQGLAAFGEGLEMEVTRSSGEYLPPADALQTGYTWDTSFESSFSMTQEEGDANLVIDGTTTSDQTSTVLNTDPVTFNGETVDGVLIQQDSGVTMTLNFMDNPVTSEVAIGSQLQLGRGIGMISQTSQTSFGDVTMELVDYYVP